MRKEPTGPEAASRTRKRPVEARRELWARSCSVRRKRAYFSASLSAPSSSEAARAGAASEEVASSRPLGALGSLAGVVTSDSPRTPESVLASALTPQPYPPPSEGGGGGGGGGSWALTCPATKRLGRSSPREEPRSGARRRKRTNGGLCMFLPHRKSRSVLPSKSHQPTGVLGPRWA